MKTPKKIWKSIAKKFKNRKVSPIATTAKGAAIEESRTSNMPEDVEEVKVEVKERTNVTGTNTQLCEDINKNSEDFDVHQPIFESSEEVQIETTVEPISEPCFDRETNEQEPNTPDSPSSAELCFDGDAADKNLSAKALQQRQAIIFGSVGAVLLVNCVALYIMKIPVVAAVVGIAGLVCIGFALYNTINPNTKLEKVEDVEQSITAHPPLNPT